MRQFFNIVVGALAMLAVALLSAFLTMRLVIHGREVEIPNVTGLTVAEASKAASTLGLNLNLENHFYSTATPAGHVLSQYPAPGTKVRREWVLRITESIGPQIVSVPNLVGQTEREASVTIRRLSLELGTVAYIPASGPAGVVLAQTPTPAAAGVDGPRISLLVSEPPPAARSRPIQSAPDANPGVSASSSLTGTPANPVFVTPPNQPADGAQSHALVATVTPGPPAATSDQPEAFVMPNLVGVSLRLAAARVAAMGLSITSVESVAGGVRAIAPITPPSAPGSAIGSGIARPIAPVAPIVLPNTVISQSPAAGRRVTKADSIHVAVSR